MPKTLVESQPGGEQAVYKKEGDEFERIVRKAMLGDNDALYVLCERIAKGVLFRTTHILNNPADAEDISQEVLIRICEKIHTLREPKAFKVWLSSIVSNETRRYMAKRAKYRDVLNIDDHMEAVMEKKKDFLPQEHVEDEESREAVMGIIASLPMRQREAVMLRYYNGLSVTEVAQAMDIAKQNASRYLALAYDKLKLKLEEQTASARTPGMAAALPLGASLAWTLHREEALFTPSNETWLETTLTKCSEFIIARKTSPIPITSRYSAATIALSGLLMSTFATIFATVALTVGIMLGGTSSIKIERPTSSVEGMVVFSGGATIDEKTVYLNPTRAEKRTESPQGEVETLKWWISKPNDDEILFEGVGDVVDDALIKLREGFGDGEYMLYFRLKDQVGGIHRMGSNFYLLDTPGSGL